MNLRTSTRVILSSRPLAVFLALTLLAIVTVPPPLRADGTQSGIVAGTVFDADGVPVQGVQVSLSGPQISRQAATDSRGRFRFPALAVGRYAVSAELLGLLAPPQDVEVQVDKITEVDLRLGEASAEVPSAPAEAIEVVAEAPLVDRFEARVGASLSQDLLDELPVERFYQSVALLLPGVSGGADGNPNTSGALRSHNLFLIDGVDTSDPTTGLFGLNLAYEAVAAVDVTTAAAPAEYGRSSGAVVNVVTRSGDREFRGRVRWIATNNDWNAGYDHAAVEAPHLAPEVALASAGDQLDSTVALHLGGPVATDKLFFSVSWEKSGRSFFHPTAIGEVWDEDFNVESGAFKLTWQPSSRHTLVAQHTFDNAQFVSYAPFEDRPAENFVPQVTQGQPGTQPPEQAVDFSGFFNFLAFRPGETYALEDRSQDGRFDKLQWDFTAGQNLTLSFNLADQRRELARGPRSLRGLTSGAPHLAPVDPSANEFYVFNGVTAVGADERPRQQGNFALSYFHSGRADHELVAGVDYQDTDSRTLLNVPGVEGLDPLLALVGEDVPVSGQLFLDYDLSFECLVLYQCAAPFDPVTGEFLPLAMFNFWRRPPSESTEKTVAVHFTDTITLPRWTFHVGVRFESTRGRSIGGQEIVKDQDVAPRVAVTYDPGGDGKVLLTASWGRYHEPFLQQYLDLFLRPFALSSYTEYIWGTVFGDDCAGEDPADVSSPCWVPSGVSLPATAQRAEPNPSLERSSVDEMVLGFERQLSPTSALSLHYVNRVWNDLWDDAPIVVGGEELFATSVKNLQEAKRRYEAIQLLLQRRSAGRWQLVGSYTWSEAKGNLFTNAGLDDFADFTDVSDVNRANRLGPAPYDRPHELRVFGTYRFDLGRSSLALASVLRYSDGTPFERRKIEPVFVDEVQEIEIDGVRFITPRGSERLSGVFQWDGALNFDLPFSGGLELELKAEVFNITDESEQLGIETLEGSPIFGLPRTLADFQAPRSYRMTLGLRF